ncbi:DUF1800 family protein [Wenyingzhuangia sp. 2_MG-2023]|uniref:DUF1800 domain-containing protein n=1 Tax=Wenyingzhuangia sp. 2_MG-2023 TaxID=3062639 RepID=UPI0026E1E361|nr:DUF1800 domain-containing protein [Wenyingzhuangia sp. 2_MG-2023]MDO6738087.1 DUF1800 domain-containing protein [Wenyingzhuangia sp. 2_MG-2023]
MKHPHLIHLYNRVGFGILPQQVAILSKHSTEKNVAILFEESDKTTPLKVDPIRIKGLEKFDSKNREERMLLQREHRKLVIQLNMDWYQQLYNTNSLLREKMTLFWANHFVCSSNNALQTEQYIAVLKNYALGNFKDFVVAISKNPMMIRYLNNQQNKKAHPNENYARELMELFTLGVGHYTEKDIQESARAFTGWSSDKTKFVFRERQHDDGEKNFMGKTGNFDGTDIINIILENKQCALFISEKIYKEFVNPEPNKKHIKKMARVFRKNYQIDELMRFVLTSDWFYDDRNRNVKIKSPVELLVGIHNVIPFEFKKDKYFQYLQYNLGQKLLYPPNVAGWPGNKQWIDANTIMLRLKLVSTIAQQKAIELEAESEFEDDFEIINKRKKNKAYYITTTVDWQHFNKEHKNTSLKDWQQVLLGTQLSSNTEQIISTINNHTAREFCITLMSLPEYQMC